MYRVLISYNDYSRWQVYDEWDEWGDDWGFDEYCMDRYPEIREIGIRCLANGDIARVFVFESEEACTWFLLQVV